MIHNSVNARLRNEEELKKSADTYIFKNQLPTVEDCGDCHQQNKWS